MEHWQAEARPVATATDIETWSSAPRPAGGKMALRSDGRIAGSVPGGCVENAVVEAGKKTLSSGKPQLLHYGVTDDTAWSVGLACGGSLDIFVERLDPELFAPVREGAPPREARGGHDRHQGTRGRGRQEGRAPRRGERGARSTRRHSNSALALLGVEGSTSLSPRSASGARSGSSAEDSSHAGRTRRLELSVN
ncbi:MAG: XdhC family protein [Thermoanaerobaculia bacterium]